MTPALSVLSPGLMTSAQDFGRPGAESLGVPVGGALDALSLRLANLIVGNAPDVAGLEMVALGPTLAIEAESVRLACVGARADLEVMRDVGSPARLFLPPGESAVLRRGDVLRIGPLRESATLYLAIEGGFAIAPVMGSLSTDLRGGFGGWRGRALHAGDRLPLNAPSAAERAEMRAIELDLKPPRRLRTLDGPQSDYFSADERAAFYARDYVVGPGWSRMAMRLTGAPLTDSRGYEVTSDAVVRGSIQIPGDGEPIVLLAEHQTTGGYPKIGAVISADLPALGRLKIGARIGFQRVTLAEAEAAQRALAELIEHLPSRLIPASAPPLGLTARLMDANLVSGVVDAAAFG